MNKIIIKSRYCITHPDVILYAIASRDADTAASQAKKYHFQKSYGSYQALLDDSEVDFVYISTPNGLHYEWASKTLKAGKHVLLEKPFTSNGAEAEALVREAEQANRVLEEAFHWQFHPAAHLFRSLLESGEYGKQIVRRRTHDSITGRSGRRHPMAIRPGRRQSNGHDVRIVVHPVRSTRRASRQDLVGRGSPLRQGQARRRRHDGQPAVQGPERRTRPLPHLHRHGARLDRLCDPKGLGVAADRGRDGKVYHSLL
ncbi:hypothetical protein HRR85_004301 [Exophiala dermatitidis]|nr:hypothetical protein HRR85_004301 [Exophiala dermatitidis]